MRLFKKMVSILKYVYDLFLSYLLVPAKKWISSRFSRGKGPENPLTARENDWKQQAMADFKTWLEEMPADPVASGTATLESCDLFTLLSEFTALRQEIRFQNREQAKSSKSMDKAVHSLLESSEVFHQNAMILVNETSALEERLRSNIEKKAVIPFFDVRDALIRGLHATKQVVENKYWFRPAPSGMDSVIEGYQMAIRRIDRAFEILGIQPVQTLEQGFDPKTMKAIGKKSGKGIEPGVVVDQVSGGFVRNGEVLRVANVIVAE